MSQPINRIGLMMYGSSHYGQELIIERNNKTPKGKIRHVGVYLCKTDMRLRRCEKLFHSKPDLHFTFTKDYTGVGRVVLKGDTL